MIDEEMRKRAGDFYWEEYHKDGDNISAIFDFATAFAQSEVEEAIARERGACADLVAAFIGTEFPLGSNEARTCFSIAVQLQLRARSAKEPE